MVLARFVVQLGVVWDRHQNCVSQVRSSRTLEAGLLIVQ